MTLNEMADLTGLDTKEDCIGFLMVAFQIIRSALQRESATFEGCCSSALEWTELYGMPSEATVRRWLADIPTLANFDIPDSFVMEQMAVED